MPTRQPATERRHWVFRNPCGCPIGVLDVDRDADTRSKAWREFYATAKERNAAMDRGVSSDEMSHAEYVTDVMPMMLSSYTCTHSAVKA